MAAHPALAKLVHVFLGVVFPVQAQIRVLTPATLVESIGSNGRLEGSTATFGAPFFGDRVYGRLVYGESLLGEAHCSKDDYEIPEIKSSLEKHGKRLINIVLVRRGKCSFVKKVKVAYEKGAHAVIILDREDSTLTAPDLQRVIVADDGYGGDIHIPSILVSSRDGNKLIQAVKQSEVIVELAWEVPTGRTVSVDMWMSSASIESQQFLQTFAPKRIMLNDKVSFNPHFEVFSLDNSEVDVYNLRGLCSDESRRFCAEDPDGKGEITGKMVLDEDVRQLCIHEKYRQPGHHAGSAAPPPPATYAREYWEYVTRFGKNCPLTGTSAYTSFGRECSQAVMQEVGIDVESIMQCVASTKDQKLARERTSTAWSPRAIRINGWRFTGMLDADLVTRAICSAFILMPPECEHAIRFQRNPLEAYNPDQSSQSESVKCKWIKQQLASGRKAWLIKQAYFPHVAEECGEDVVGAALSDGGDEGGWRSWWQKQKSFAKHFAKDFANELAKEWAKKSRGHTGQEVVV